MVNCETAASNFAPARTMRGEMSLNSRSSGCVVFSYLPTTSVRRVLPAQVMYVYQQHHQYPSKPLNYLNGSP